MPYTPPVREHLFLLQEVFDIDRYSNLPGFADVQGEMLEQVLEAAGAIAGEVLAPLNKVGDRQGCKLNDDGSVTTPEGFKEAYQQFREGGWTGLDFPSEWGGQDLPHVVSLAVNEFVCGANQSFAMYPGLSHAAVASLLVHGTDEQKQTYLPKLVSGEWTGTMNLTEPHCGTDLGMLRTKAVPNGDGSYAITGEKIWISAGEHGMSDNIIHLVLARIEGAPQGVKGISLFIVPKLLPDADGNPGERNSLRCTGLEEKMGIHGNATCFMAYEGAKGWLVGEENGGLRAMFIMMNSARLGVGLQGLAIGEAAHQAAVEFAKERLQGRSLTGPKNPDGPADPIIVHPDVRRMLLDSRSILEAGRAFCLWTSLCGDLQTKSQDEAERQKAGDYMGLLTPVVKAYLTDEGFRIASQSMQVHGGSGFTEHYPVSQNMRDARIAMIYEGTNGVQALDLVGRKLAANGGRAVMTFFGEIDGYVSEREGRDELKPYVDALKGVKAQLQEATFWLMQNGMANPDNAGAASVDYLRLFGLTAMTYMWARIAESAQAKVAEGATDRFYADKLVVGRFFLERVLPEAPACLARLKTGSATIMELPAEAF